MSELKKPDEKEKVSPTPQETETAAYAVPAIQETESVVYIGPDIPGAKQYTTYNSGLPDTLKEQIQEYHIFESLVIPVGKLAWAMAELGKEGSALNTLYQKASEKLKKKER